MGRKYKILLAETLSTTGGGKYNVCCWAGNVVVCYWVEILATGHKIQSSGTRQKLCLLGRKYHGLSLNMKLFNDLYCGTNCKPPEKFWSPYSGARCRENLYNLYSGAKRRKKWWKI